VSAWCCLARLALHTGHMVNTDARRRALTKELARRATSIMAADFFVVRIVTFRCSSLQRHRIFGDELLQPGGRGADVVERFGPLDPVAPA
jgi:hypothetical protein